MSASHLPTWLEGVLRVLGTGGLGLWHMRPAALRQRRARQGECPGCGRRHHRLLRLIAVLVGIQALGLVALIVQSSGIPACAAPVYSTQQQAAAFTQQTEGLLVRVRQALTAGQTGLALGYARANGAEVCRFAPNGNLVAQMQDGFARGGTMYGHVFLTYPRPDMLYAERASLEEHESRHTAQWALFTAIGGPLGFPIAYSLDEAFAPGAHNHFERDAGLVNGGYEQPDGPSPAACRALIAAAVIGLFLFERHRFRRHVVLLAALVHRVRRPGAAPPWWYAYTQPVSSSHLRRWLTRVSPAAAAIIGEHHRLRQLGCAGCGDIPAFAEDLLSGRAA